MVIWFEWAAGRCLWDTNHLVSGAGVGMDCHRRQELRQEIELSRNPGLAVDKSRRVYLPVKKALTLNCQSPDFY